MVQKKIHLTQISLEDAFCPLFWFTLAPAKKPIIIIPNIKTTTRKPGGRLLWSTRYMPLFLDLFLCFVSKGDVFFVFRERFLNMYLLTEWEARTGKHLAWGHGLRTKQSNVRVPLPRANISRPNSVNKCFIITIFGWILARKWQTFLVRNSITDELCARKLVADVCGFSRPARANLSCTGQFVNMFSVGLCEWGRTVVYSNSSY